MLGEGIMRNPNPIVHEGPYGKCGATVFLFEQDVETYLAAPHRGLVHFLCPVQPEDDGSDEIQEAYE